MKFSVDKVEIQVRAGNGGNGKVSFRREKYIPKGGPDGGDGGDGGNVYFEVNPNMSTLYDFRSKPKYAGQDGEPGGAKNMTGRDGEDLVIKIPSGTVIYQIDAGKTYMIADMTGEDESSSRYLVAKGGRGGKGNTRFKSSVNQAPMRATPGRKGEVKYIVLEIKLIADVGLVGFPNSGKSTLVNSFAGGAAKVDSYPFTTLMPNLGVRKMKNDEVIVLADIPGLIEGASEGKGLGDEFLRHVERTRVLVHMIDPTSLFGDEVDYEAIMTNPDKMCENSISRYNAIRKELEKHTGNSLGYGLVDLTSKPEIIVVNKIDLTEVREVLPKIQGYFEKQGKKVLGISAVTKENFDQLEGALLEVLAKTPRSSFKNKIEIPVKRYTIEDLRNRRIVKG